MDKKQFQNNVKRSLQVLLYIYQTKHGRNSEPKASDLTIHWWETQKTWACEVNFNCEFQFETEDPDVAIFAESVNKYDDIQMGFFSSYEVDKNGDFVNRTIPLSDSDDMIGLFNSCNYKWMGHEQKNTTVGFSYSYNVFDIEIDK